MSGLGALKKFGEALMRKADAGDPRLRRALDMGFDLENPVVHGTNKPLLDKKLQYLFTAREPGLALDFIGGGRAAGPRAIGSNMHPLLLRGTPYKTELSAFDQLDYATPAVAERLGIADPEAFMARVQARNALRNGPDSPWVSDKHWGIWGHRPDDTFEPRPSFFFQFLDNGAFRQGLLEEGIDSLEFAHPYLAQDITAAGKLKNLKEKLPGSAILSMNPANIRSPWAAFEEEGVGLLKKQGGLVQMRGCK